MIYSYFPEKYSFTYTYIYITYTYTHTHTYTHIHTQKCENKTKIARDTHFSHWGGGFD